VKRSAALAPLSREHHVALEVALRLRRATDPAAARDAFLRFFDDEGEAHFAAEETVLLPFVSDVLPADDPDVVRVLDEHRELRRRAAALRSGARADEHDLRELGALLEGHVRHEERVLFPRIEAALDGARRGELGDRLHEAGEGHTPPRV